jgi:hypothetical protein
MKFRKSKNQLETSEVESYPVYENLGGIIDVTLCPKVNGSYEKCCLDRKCGVGKLKFSMNETEKISFAANVEWQRYEYVNENPKGTATKRRLTLVRKVTKVGEMFDYFKTRLETCPAHQHRANWQRTQMKSLIQNLPPKHCICIHDYSENYRCVENNEMQSNYFQHTECSLHVTMIHRHAMLEYDGFDSTDDFPEIITEYFFVISPDLQHDHNFTKCAQQQIKQYLDSISYDVDVMHEFTDGCSSECESRLRLFEIGLKFRMLSLSTDSA